MRRAFRILVAAALAVSARCGDLRPAFAGAVVTLKHHAGGGGGGSFTDDFANGTFTWVPVTSTWGESGGTLNFSAGTSNTIDAALYSAANDSTQDPTSTFNQWAQVQLVTFTESMGFFFNANGATIDSTHRIYYVSVSTSNSVYVGDATSTTGGSDVDINPAGNTDCGTWAATNYISAEWTSNGTTSVTVKLWKWASAPPARGNGGWGSTCSTGCTPECAVISGTLRAAPGGKGLGVTHYGNPTSGTHSFDNFAGGDQ